MIHTKVNDKQFCIVKIIIYFLLINQVTNYMNRVTTWINIVTVFLPAVMTMKSFLKSPVADGIVWRTNYATKEIIHWFKWQQWCRCNGGTFIFICI